MRSRNRLAGFLSLSVLMWCVPQTWRLYEQPGIFLCYSVLGQISKVQGLGRSLCHLPVSIGLYSRQIKLTRPKRDLISHNFHSGIAVTV